MSDAKLYLGSIFIGDVCDLKLSLEQVELVSDLAEAMRTKAVIRFSIPMGYVHRRLLVDPVDPPGQLVSADELRRAGPGFEVRMPGMDL